MSQPLSIYLDRPSRVQRLHPLTKLALVGFILVTGLSLPGIWAGYAVLLLLVLPLAFAARVQRELLVTTLKVTIPFALSIFLIQGFLWPGGTPLVSLGPISLKSEGLVFAIRSVGRIMVVVSGFLWFAYTTRPDRLMAALNQKGLPKSLVYMVVATLQIVPRFQARATAILDAQRSRGLETGGSLLRRSRALVPLVVPLVLSSLIDVEERAIAIEARGFNRAGLKTSLVEISEAAWEPLARWGILLAAIVMVGASIWLRIAP
jgi:energy-coupling factor transport system permease protein